MSDLVGNPEDRFSRVAAHFVLIGTLNLNYITIDIFDMVISAV